MTETLRKGLHGYTHDKYFTAQLLPACIYTHTCFSTHVHGLIHGGSFLLLVAGAARLNLQDRWSLPDWACLIWSLEETLDVESEAGNQTSGPAKLC